MLIWSALVTAVLTGLTLGLFTTGAPEWATQAGELVTVVRAASPRGRVPTAPKFGVGLRQ